MKNDPGLQKDFFISLKSRDNLAKTRTKEIGLLIKKEISDQYKRYRNMNVTLLKRSNRNYYTALSLPKTKGMLKNLHKKFQRRKTT